MTDVGAWRVICLDTTVPGSNGGHLPDNQLDLLESALAEAPERPALVATHHNAMPITHWHDTMMIDNPQRLFQLLARWPQARVLLGPCASRVRPSPAQSAHPGHALDLLPVQRARRPARGRRQGAGLSMDQAVQDGSLATGVRRVQEPAVNAAEAARAA